ncbi:hypothetical protein AB0R12_29565, partial [Streptomyces niveus]
PTSTTRDGAGSARCAIWRCINWTTSAATGTVTATGFRVAGGERPGTVRVEWLGPHGSGAAQDEERQLTACAAVLTPLGWEALLYRGPRRRRFLEVEPAL